MSYSSIFFDLDGTLTNSKEGVINSFKYSLDRLNISDYNETNFDQFIGPPLQDSFKDYFKLSKPDVDKAVLLFREYYSEKGIYENQPYPGISELLSELSSFGKKIYVATSKLEKYARIVLDHFQLSTYIDDLKGADYGGKHSDKSHIIQELLDRIGPVNKSEIVMIGDTHFDMKGAIKTGLNKIAVGYGFGSKENLMSYNPDFFADTVEDLHEFLLV